MLCFRMHFVCEYDFAARSLGQLLLYLGFLCELVHFGHPQSFSLQNYLLMLLLNALHDAWMCFASQCLFALGSLHT